MNEFYMRYVSHARVPQYEALGWAVAGDGSRMGAHAAYSCLMKWVGGGLPAEPTNRPTPAPLDSDNASGER